MFKIVYIKNEQTLSTFLCNLQVFIYKHQKKGGFSPKS